MGSNYSLQLRSMRIRGNKFLEALKMLLTSRRTSLIQKLLIWVLIFLNALHVGPLLKNLRRFLGRMNIFSIRCRHYQLGRFLHIRTVRVRWKHHHIINLLKPHPFTLNLLRLNRSGLCSILKKLLHELSPCANFITLIYRQYCLAAVAKWVMILSFILLLELLNNLKLLAFA